MKLCYDLLVKIRDFLLIDDVIKYSFVNGINLTFEICFKNNEITDGINEPYTELKQDKSFINYIDSTCHNYILCSDAFLSFSNELFEIDDDTNCVFKMAFDDLPYESTKYFFSKMNTHKSYPYFQTNHPLLLSRNLLINKYYKLMFYYGQYYITEYEHVAWFIFGICDNVEKELVNKYIENCNIDDWMSFMRFNFFNCCEKYFCTIRYVLLNTKTFQILIVEHFFENGGSYDTQFYYYKITKEKYKIMHINDIGKILYCPYSIL